MYQALSKQTETRYTEVACGDVAYPPTRCLAAWLLLSLRESRPGVLSSEQKPRLKLKVVDAVDDVVRQTTGP